MAERRLAELADIRILELTEDALALATDLLDKGSLPKNAAEDALHIAIATVHGIGYLLTWNCRHMANAQMRQAVVSRWPRAGTKRRSFVHRKSSWDYRDMWLDPIVEEVRKIREAHAARFNYDLRAIYQDLKDREKQSGWKLESRPPKRHLRAS